MPVRRPEARIFGDETLSLANLAAWQSGRYIEFLCHVTRVTSLTLPTLVKFRFPGDISVAEQNQTARQKSLTKKQGPAALATMTDDSQASCKLALITRAGMHISDLPTAAQANTAPQSPQANTRLSAGCVRLACESRVMMNDSRRGEPVEHARLLHCC